MPSRHQIREVTVQLLYCLQAEGKASPDTTDFSSFWDVLLDQDTLKLCTARTKAVEHLTLDREPKLAQFEERLQKALPALADNEDAGSELNLLQGISASERAWTVRQHNLFSYFKSKTENKTEELAHLLNEFFTVNTSLINQRHQLFTLVESHPQLGPVLDPVLGSARKLQTTGEKVDAAAHPRNYPKNNDVKHLRSAENKLTKLQEEVGKFTRNLLPHLEKIDNVIEQAVENYSPERLAAVDRAVLRLATYEIIFSPELSLPIVISEAVETAMRFSGTDAARFVNGVLDKVGSICRPH